jgi:hypothetical protein
MLPQYGPRPLKVPAAQRQSNISVELATSYQRIDRAARCPKNCAGGTTGSISRAHRRARQRLWLATFADLARAFFPNGAKIKIYHPGDFRRTIECTNCLIGFIMRSTGKRNEPTRWRRTRGWLSPRARLPTKLRDLQRIGQLGWPLAATCCGRLPSATH